jgi:hypothetical protein
LEEWAEDQIENDGKDLDWAKESTFYGLTFQLKTCMLRNYYPNMSQVVRVFWSFLCSSHYLDAMLIILTAPANESLVVQFGFDEWDAAIETCITCSYNGSDAYPSMRPKETVAEKLLHALIKSAKSPKNLDVWERGCLRAAGTGCINALKLVSKAGLVKVRSAFLLRSAADGAHWNIVEFCMSQLAGMSKQEHRVAMYRSLYMLQQGSQQERWEIVDQVISAWRVDKSEPFSEKWKVACEMACERGGLGLLEKLLDIRSKDEKLTHVITLKMLALVFAGPHITVANLLIDNTPRVESSTSLLNDLPEGADRLRGLFLRLCNTPEADIDKEMKSTQALGSAKFEDVSILVANVVRHVLSFGGIDQNDPMIMSAFRTLITNGNQIVGKVLREFDIQFDWMEESTAIKVDTKSDPIPFVGVNSAQMKQNEYTAYFTAMGFVDENMISFEDFEVH